MGSDRKEDKFEVKAEINVAARAEREIKNTDCKQNCHD
jgi:hypothetical protein